MMIPLDRFPALFFTRTIISFFLLFLNGSGVMVGKAASESTDVIMCPALYFHDIKVLDALTKEEKIEPSKEGDEVWLVCEKDISEDYVYPAAKRKCLQNGKWSSLVTPACVNSVPQNEPANSVANYCATGIKSIDCAQLFKKWKKVGKTKDPSGRIDAFNHNVHSEDGHEIQEILYRFRSLLVLSFMIFNVPFDSNNFTKNYSVQIYVPSDDVSQDLNDTNSTIAFRLKKHFDLFSQRISMSREGYTKNDIVEIGAYVKQVLVRFVTSKGRDYDAKYNSTMYKYSWDPETEFFPLTKPKSYGVCPKEPTIPNAAVSDRSTESVTYKCQEGYDMVDLFSGKSLNNGTITCHDGNWGLHPFPACRNATAIARKAQFEMSYYERKGNTADSPKISKNFPSANVPEYATFANDSKARNVKENAESTKEKEKKSDDLMFLLTVVSLLATGLCFGFTIVILCVIFWKKLNSTERDERLSKNNSNSKSFIARFLSVGQYSAIQDGYSEDGSRRSSLYSSKKIPGAPNHEYDYPKLI